MLFFGVALAAPVPEAPAPALPPIEEQAEQRDLERLRPVEREAVPAWPDLRRFERNHENLLIGAAFAAVSGVLVVAAMPDRGLVPQPWLSHAIGPL